MSSDVNGISSLQSKTAAGSDGTAQVHGSLGTFGLPVQGHAKKQLGLQPNKVLIVVRLYIEPMFPLFWFVSVCLWPYYDEMTQCCHLLHESANELVASHSFVWWLFGFVLVSFCFRFVLFVLLFAFACFGC